jgi:hypothetical protein
MSQGWRTPLTPEGYDDFPNHVIAVLADRSYPEPEHITEILRSAPGDAVVLVRFVNKLDLPILQAVTAAGYDPVVVGPHPHWKGIDGWRDTELLNTCSRVLVFRDSSSDAKLSWSKLLADPTWSRVWEGKLFVFVKGKKKAKPKKKGRKVE